MVRCLEYIHKSSYARVKYIKRYLNRQNLRIINLKILSQVLDKTQKICYNTIVAEKSATSPHTRGRIEIKIL